MHTELGQTGLSWPQPKLDADVVHQVPGMEDPIVTAKIPFVFWTNTDVILSHQCKLQGSKVALFCRTIIPPKLSFLQYGRTTTSYRCNGLQLGKK